MKRILQRFDEKCCDVGRTDRPHPRKGDFFKCYLCGHHVICDRAVRSVVVSTNTETAVSLNLNGVSHALQGI